MLIRKGLRTVLCHEITSCPPVTGMRSYAVTGDVVIYSNTEDVVICSSTGDVDICSSTGDVVVCSSRYETALARTL